MERITVSNARETLELLQSALTNAYWDSNNVFQKDTLFDMVTTIQSEINEISKLSVNDYNIRYEPIIAGFPAYYSKFKRLQSELDNWFPREKTAITLEESLASVITILSDKER